MFVLLLATICILSLIIYGFRPITLLTLSHIPGPPPVWLLGNLPDIVNSGKHEAFRQWATTYGKVYKIFEGGVPTIVIQDPEYARKINSRMPNRHPIPYMETGEEEKFNAAGVLFARNAHHRGLRAAWQPMFHSTSLSKFMGLMLDATKDMCNDLQNAAKSGESIDIWNMFGDLTMKISSVTAFGTTLDGELVEAAKAFFDAAGMIENVYALLQLSFPGLAPLVRVLATKCPTKEYKAAMQGRHTVRKAVSARLEQHRKSGKTAAATTEVAPGSFLDLMSKSVNKDTGKSFNEMEIVCQAFSFVLAAYETTTAAMAFAVYLISLNPQVEERVLKEIDAFGSKKDVTFDDLHKFPYTEAVFAETLRLYPTVPLTIREADRDIDLGNYTIPKGTHLAVSVFGLHHSPEYWDDPESFKPERFLGKDVNTDFPAYMPFGGGTRACIGQRYAWQEAVIALVTLYQRFRFVVEPGQVPLPVRMSLSLSPKHGVKVKVFSRN